MGKNYLIGDTETAGSLERPRVYDLGWVITNAKGEPLTRKSFIIKEIFEDQSLMNTAFYAEKLPQYYEGIKTGEWVVKTFAEARATLLADMVQYNCTEFYAYNCKFDEKALNMTARALSNEWVESFLPRNVKYRDIWGYAQDCICATKSYVSWAVENSAFTPTGRISTNAENVYRYLIKNVAFNERHTAADDAMIESYILHRARHMPRKGSFDWKGPKLKAINAIRAELGI